MKRKPFPWRQLTPTQIDLMERIEAAGVIFVDENGEGAGVRLRKAADTSE